MAGKMQNIKKVTLCNIFRCLRFRLVFVPFLLVPDTCRPPDP